jgi:hypothetical protein
VLTTASRPADRLAHREAAVALYLGLVATWLVVGVRTARGV